MNEKILKENLIVKLSFTEQFHVPVDSDVRLENLSALGESYLELVPRNEGGPMLRDGERIATESVIQPASISELATSVVRGSPSINNTRSALRTGTLK